MGVFNPNVLYKLKEYLASMTMCTGHFQPERAIAKADSNMESAFSVFYCS